MVGDCLNPDRRCPYIGKKRRSVGHHLFYPRTDYETPLEKAFRSLPENIMQRCVCVESQDPHLRPKEKPSLLDMCMALTVKIGYEG